jgi:hypothetical protein
LIDLRKFEMNERWAWKRVIVEIAGIPAFVPAFIDLSLKPLVDQEATSHSKSSNLLFAVGLANPSATVLLLVRLVHRYDR